MTDSIQKVLAEMRDIGDSATWPAEVHKWADRIESLLNAEPVAWVLLGKDGAPHYRSVPPTATIAESYQTRPLYAAPQPSGDCAALREALEDVEYFLGQIDPVHWPSRSEARGAIGVVREALSSTAAQSPSRLMNQSLNPRTPNEPTTDRS